MASREHRIPRVRDVVELAIQPLRLVRGDHDAAQPMPHDADGAPDAATPLRRDDARCEELTALHEVERDLGDQAAPADRATRSAQAYLEARRRRLRRELDEARRGA